MTRLHFVSALGLSALLLGCPGSGLSTKLCGAPGQPCCADAVCNPGTVCGGDAKCAACGAEGQACCAASACNGALSCRSSTCVDLCVTPSCTLGSQRCAAPNGLERCDAEGPCTVWKPFVSACPTGTLCQADAGVADCVEVCPGACVVDAVLCSVDGLRRCTLPSGASCPGLVSEPDDADRPQCLTGGLVGSELVWESPTPFNSPIADIAGDLASSYWVLDRLGNIVRYAVGPWEYELRPTAGKKMLAIASCNLGSRLYAVGEAGTVFRRSGGAWTEESVGDPAVRLLDVVCDSSRAIALGDNGRLYVRGSTPTWGAIDSGALVSMRALAYLFSSQEIFLLGDSGAAIKCTGYDVPATALCAPESTGSTASLKAAWGSVFSGEVYAVGAQGTMLVRESTGVWRLLTTGTTQGLVAVHGFWNQSDGRAEVVAVGRGGTWVAFRQPNVLASSVVADEDLSAVNATGLNAVIAGDEQGAQWAASTIIQPATPNVRVRGGRKPISEALNAIASIGGGRLFAVGDNGGRYRRENNTWLNDGAGLAVSDPLFGVTAPSAGEVYAVGDLGRVLLRRYGTWQDDRPGVSGPALWAAAHDATTVYAVGDNGTWLERSRTGSGWTAVAVGVPESLRALAVRTDASGKAVEVVAVGDDCTLVSKTTGAPTRVVIAACPAGFALLSATFNSTGDLYLGGEGGLLLRRLGTTFQREFPQGTDLDALYGLASNGPTVWASGESGRLYRRGAGWTRLAQDVTTRGLSALTYDAAEGLFVVGSAGLVWRVP